MRARFFTLLLTTAFLPSVVFAAGSLPAGFAPGSLWLSKTEAIAGDTLKVYTVVYDSSSSPIEGDVVFNVDTKELGTQHFKLAAGETQIVSSDWTATVGTHTFGASLKNITGVDSAVSNIETNSVSIRVAAAAPSPITEYKNAVTNIIASSSPAVQNVANTVFNTTEDWRHAGSDFLSKALYDNATSSTQAGLTPTKSGDVLGTSTVKAISSSIAQKNGILGSIWRSILQVLLLIFTIKYLFYAVFLIVLYILYRIVRSIIFDRRPREA